MLFWTTTSRLWRKRQRQPCSGGEGLRHAPRRIALNRRIKLGRRLESDRRVEVNRPIELNRRYIIKSLNH